VVLGWVLRANVPSSRFSLWNRTSPTWSLLGGAMAVIHIESLDPLELPGCTVASSVRSAACSGRGGGALGLSGAATSVLSVSASIGRDRESKERTELTSKTTFGAPEAVAGGSMRVAGALPRACSVDGNGALLRDADMSDDVCCRLCSRLE
jgi:hypothetical protein